VDPPLNVSIKISALYSQIHPTDPETAVQRLSERLRPILRRAVEMGAFINFDMESFAFKDLTIRLFESIFSEPEFASGRRAAWRSRPTCVTAKTICANSGMGARTPPAHRHPPGERRLLGTTNRSSRRKKAGRRPSSPARRTRRELREAFRLLLENDAVVGAAFGTHNVRAMAAALAQGRSLGVPLRNVWVQMILAWRSPIKLASSLNLGCGCAEYTPVVTCYPACVSRSKAAENTATKDFYQQNSPGASVVISAAQPAELTSTVPRGPSSPQADAGESKTSHPWIFTVWKRASPFARRDRPALKASVGSIR